MQQAHDLVIDGHGIEGRIFSMADIRRLAPQRLGPTVVKCMTGRMVSESESFLGVKLTDILDLTGLRDLHRGELKQCVILAQARDGYRAMFTWLELYNSPVGPGALVAYERNGQPLDGGLGNLCLVSSHDLHLGPRHLRDLCAIRIQKI